MSFTSLTERDLQVMLERIGVGSLAELFADIPESLRLGRALDVGPALTESELVAHMTELAAATSTTAASCPSWAPGCTTATCPRWST